MRIVCKVAAEFRDDTGSVIFTIRPDQRLMILDAPEAIRQDPLFDWMVTDGTLNIAGFTATLKELENDPVHAGTPEPAEEKKIEIAEKSVEAPPATTGSTRKKT